MGCCMLCVGTVFLTFRVWNVSLRDVASAKVCGAVTVFGALTSTEGSLWRLSLSLSPCIPCLKSSVVVISPMHWSVWFVCTPC